MNQNQPSENQPRPPAIKPTPDTDSLTDHEKQQLADETTQAEYRKAYLAQLRARQCPGCGEGDTF